MDFDRDEELEVSLDWTRSAPVAGALVFTVKPLARSRWLCVYSATVPHASVSSNNAASARTLVPGLKNDRIRLAFTCELDARLLTTV